MFPERDLNQNQKANSKNELLKLSEKCGTNLALLYSYTRTISQNKQKTRFSDFKIYFIKILLKIKVFIY